MRQFGTWLAQCCSRVGTILVDKVISFAKAPFVTTVGCMHGPGSWEGGGRKRAGTMEQGKSHTLHLMFTGRASAEEKESNRNFHSFPSAEWKMGRQKQKEKENRYKMAA